MADYETFQHDVLVIGSGGAGLRAAIEASAAGVSVGMVCKGLLGKAHTVMAEGGIAAALANVDDRDNWKVHFADTMYYMFSGPDFLYAYTFFPNANTYILAGLEPVGQVIRPWQPSPDE